MANPVEALGLVYDASATFTRPADTTQYAIGDLVANNVTASSVAPMQFTVARHGAGSFMIRRARVKKTNTSTTSASFRVHLYKADPSASSGITNGDNGAWLTKEATYLGAIDVTMDKVFSDFAKGVGSPNEGFEVNGVVSDTVTIIYGLLEARATYTPASAESFTITLEVWPGA